MILFCYQHNKWIKLLRTLNIPITKQQQTRSYFRRSYLKLSIIPIMSIIIRNIQTNVFINKIQCQICYF